MITTTPGADFEARVVGFPTGKTGLVGVRILDHAGNVLRARTTTGIVEDVDWPSVGSYTVTLPSPTERTDDDAPDEVFWDWDNTDPPNPDRTAGEDLIVQGPLEYQPNTTDVAALIWARTRDSNGVEGAFTTDTRPTYEQATMIVEKATRELALKIGLVIPDRLVESAQNTVALLAASRIELSFFPDQVTAGRSPYTELYAQYTAALAELTRAVVAAEEEDGTLDEFGPSGMPVFSFPTLGGSPRAPGSEDALGWPAVEW